MKKDSCHCKGQTWIDLKMQKATIIRESETVGLERRDENVRISKISVGARLSWTQEWVGSNSDYRKEQNTAVGWTKEQ